MTNFSSTPLSSAQAKAALEWYIDNGVDEVLGEEPVDRTKEAPPPVAQNTSAAAPSSPFPQRQSPSVKNIQPTTTSAIASTAEARATAIELAKSANTLDELREAITNFDSLAIKKTAMNTVFGDGNPQAEIMLIGDAPEADDDRAGKPFSGEAGALLDKILTAVNLTRGGDDLTHDVYVSNILNWRPPGGRTPSKAELEISLPFIERHIALVQPKILIICSGAAGKALLGSSQSMARLRKKFHEYTVQTGELGEASASIPAIVTHAPAYLIKNPAHKRAVWEDMQMVQARLNKDA